MDVATIRAAFPQFNDTEKFPSDTIAHWLTVATTRLDPNLWQENLEEGLLLLTAHKITLANPRAAGLSASGAIVASKSVGPGSISYDNSLTAQEGAGEYNSTIPGRQFWMLAGMVGAGADQQLSPKLYDFGSGFGPRLFF